MAAGNQDYFTEVGNPGSATVMSAPGHAVSGTSINVGSTSNWPTASGVVFAIDTVSIVNGVTTRNVGSYTEWEGVVSSGTTITSMVLRYGTDQPYPAGSTTRVYIPVASSRENRLVQGIQVHADQDGTLKAGAVDNSAVLADGVVTSAKIADGAIVTADIANGAVTNPKLSLTGSQSTYVATSENTTSTTYTDLATTTDTVTVTTGASGLALVSISAQAGNNVNAQYAFISFAVSGATTIAAGTYYGGAQEPGGSASSFYNIGGTFLVTGLTPGTNTFKLKYRSSPTGTAVYLDRRISVIPL